MILSTATEELDLAELDELRTAHHEIREQIAKRFGEITILEAEDIAGAILYAIGQPAHVSVNEVLIRPSGQVG